MARTAELFRNGRSQAVCLPCEFRFQGTEVFIRPDPETLSATFWGEVERAEKVPSLDTILGMAKGLQISPAALLVDREDDPNLRKKTYSLIDRATPEQLALLHRIAKVIVIP